jgi:26S proteasome regulatory subunit N9
MMDLDAIPNFLADQRDAAPDDLQGYYLLFEDYWERRLWHELTNTLVEFFEKEESAPYRISLYNTFIKSFADKINRLKLVKLGLNASSEYKSRCIASAGLEVETYPFCR